MFNLFNIHTFLRVVNIMFDKTIISLKIKRNNVQKFNNAHYNAH